MQFDDLILDIHQTNHFFNQQVVKQVNTMLTLRNWLIGFHLAEYEQLGADRAAYGAKLLQKIAQKLKERKIKGLSLTHLKLFGQFYDTYPQIGQTLSDQLKLPLSVEQKIQTLPIITGVSTLSPDIQLLLNQLSFSHFIAFLKCDTPLQRAFYETYERG